MSSQDPFRNEPPNPFGSVPQNPTFGQPLATPPSSSSGCGVAVVLILVVGGGLLTLVIGGIMLVGFMAFRAVEQESADVRMRIEEMAPMQELPMSEIPMPADGFGGPPGAPGMPPSPLANSPPLVPLLPPVAPIQSLPVVKHRPEDEYPLAQEPFAGGLQQFDERAPEGGVLVGLRLMKGRNWGGAICAVQAIYQVGDKYELGQVKGQGGAIEQQEFLAKPGYAIGAIHTRVGLVLNAVRLEFRKVKEQGLDVADTYLTPWYGCPGGSERLPSDGKENFLIGLCGTFHLDLRDLSSYCLITLPTPSSALPRLVDAKEVTRMKAGNAFGNEFADPAPEGGILVGFRVFKGTNWGGAIRAIQPIYQVGGEFKLGKTCGQSGGTLFQLLPPAAGYAVGKIETDAGLVFDGLRVTWERVRPDGTLDPSDAKTSDYVGVRGGQVAHLNSNGLPLGGVFGYWQEDVNQLGFVVVRPSSVQP